MHVFDELLLPKLLAVPGGGNDDAPPLVLALTLVVLAVPKGLAEALELPIDDDDAPPLLLLAFGLKLPSPAAAAPPLVLLLIPAPAGVAALPKGVLVVGKVLLPASLVFVLDADAVVEEGVLVLVLPKGGELL